MAYTESCRAINAIAGTAVTVNRFVIIAADGEADHSTTAHEIVDGICGMTAAAGESFPMQVPDGGVAKIEASAAIARGALVAATTAGKAVTAGTTAGNFACGRALQAAAADGDIISIQFVHKRTAAGA